MRPPPAFDPATAVHEFRLISSDYIAALVLPPLIERVRLDAPNIDLQVRAASRTFYNDLGEHGADLGFAVRVPPEAGVRVRKLFGDRFVCVVRDDHPVGARLDLDAFLRLPHALVAPLGDRGGFVDNALAELGHGPRRIALTVPHFFLAPPLIAASDLIITLPERIARMVCASYPLRIVPLPIKVPAFDVVIAWHERVHRDPANVWLREQVVKSMRT